MKRISILLTAALFTLSIAPVLYAGEIKDEYFKVKDQLNINKDTEEKRKKQLHETMTANIRRVLQRYFKYENAENAEVTTDNYERSELDANLYYFRYDNYVGFFQFANNPEVYFALPREESILRRPGTEDENRDDDENNTDNENDTQ